MTSTNQRRRVIGVDIRAEHPFKPDGHSGYSTAEYEQIVDQARLRSMRTHLRLVATFDATNMPEERETADGLGTTDKRAGLWLRFVARRDDVHITDKAIYELLDSMPDQLHWSELIKLEEFDAVAAFTPFPSL
ncbi:MAG: hypothetical protein M1483_07125 [Actinobacteria bacterium]|nr:hypothetical protein [Actinomycetota bacterium]MCL6105381.1 hypothetical protein [Actinomycetota bacterium]